MKNIMLWATGLLILAGCETPPKPTSWENDCQRNYSENERELAACKKRMENSAMKSFSRKSGTVSVDPENANLPADDEIRKSHDAS